MRNKFCLIFFLVFWVAVAGPLAAQNDVKGSKDHPLFTRMPGFFIKDYRETPFDAVKFKDPDTQKDVSVEGKKVYINYVIRKPAQTPSPLQIIKNYCNAIEAIGGKSVSGLYGGGGWASMKIVKDGAETWVYLRVTAYGEVYDLSIIEKEEMKQQVESNAASMSRDISATGKVALYGIYFDTDKAEIKPESEPMLKEIAKLLADNKGLKLFVVGHTDNSGEFQHNMKLSQLRAEAVVKALVSRYAVAAGRLLGQGVGPLAPAASNHSEQGKAKNRRVELVEQ